MAMCQQSNIEISEARVDMAMSTASIPIVSSISYLDSPTYVYTCI